MGRTIMVKWGRWVVAAAVVVVVVYLLSAGFLFAEEEKGLSPDEEIFELQGRLESQDKALHLALLENAQLKKLLNATAPLMCGSLDYPSIPPQGSIFEEVSLFEETRQPIYGTTHGGTWGRLDVDVLSEINRTSPELFINSYNGKSSELLTYRVDGGFYEKLYTFPGPSKATCWGDFDKDGQDDLLQVGNGPDKIWMYKKDHFLDSTSKYEYNATNGVACFLWDANRDGMLDIYRLNGTHLSLHIQSPLHVGGKFLDVTNKTNITESITKFIGHIMFGNMRLLAFISGDTGLLEFYNIRVFPFQKIWSSGLRWYPDLVDAVFYDMNNDQRLDIILLYKNHPPVLAINFAGIHFNCTKLPLPDCGNLDCFNVKVEVGDFNNDMLPDIFLVRSGRFSNAPNVLYINKGNDEFEIEPNAGGAAGTALGTGETVQIADYDFDGFVDLIVFNGGGDPPFNVGPTQIFHNKLYNGNNWIEIDLTGVDETANGIGAIVKVTANDVTQMQIVTSLKSRRLHFGIGNATIVTLISVKWPARRKTQEYHGTVRNQIVNFWDSLVPNNVKEVGDVLRIRATHHIQCEEPLERLVPSFYILGIWKAGTTSLAYSLAFHPQLIAPSNKELFWYTYYQEFLPVEWYQSWFPCSNSSVFKTYESTAGYLYNPDVPGRLYNYTPNAKLIVMLRDPASRAYSHFQMTFPGESDLPKKFDDVIQLHIAEFNRCLEEQRSVTACMDFASRVFLTPGLYYYLLQWWFQFFKPEQFIFVEFGDFTGLNYQQVLAEIQTFVGLQVHELPLEARNVSPKRAPMYDSTKKLLKEFYKPYNKLLYKLLGRDFGWDDP